MADAGFKLTVEGEKEFKKALAEINAQIKVNKSEIKLLTEEFKLNDAGMTTLQNKQQALAESMDLQGDKVKLLEQQYKSAAEQYGETDARVMKMKESLNLASAELVKTTAEWEKNQKTLAAYDETLEQVAAAEKELSESLSQIESGLRVNTSELKLMDAQYAKAEDAAEGLAAKNRVLTDSVEKQQQKIEVLTKALNAAEDEYGQQSKEVAEYREQLNNAQADLINMTQQIEKNAEALERVGKEDLGGLNGSLDEILDKIGIEIPAGLKDVVGGFDGAAVAAGGITAGLVAAGGKLVDIYKETMDWADELTTKSLTMGIDTEELQALEYAAAALGVSTETIDDALKEINNKAGETDKIVGKYVGNIKALQQASEEERKAVSEATAEWEALGVRIYDENNNLRDAIDIFYDLVDAFGKTTNATERQKQMQDLLGESARKLNPIIDAGRTTLEGLKQEAYETGVVLSGDTIAALDRSATSWEKWSAQVKSAVRSIPEALGNLFTGKWLENIPKLFENIKLPGYETGTFNHPGGMAVVGERGPELVSLPAGSQVIPNDKLPNLSGEGDVINVTVHVSNIKELQDIVRIAKRQKQNIRMGYVGG